MSNAEELKREGNDHFRAQRWEEALATYRSALGHLPARPQLQTRVQGRDADPIEDDSEDSRVKDEPVEESSVRPESPDAQAPPTEVEIECAKARAVLHANIGACYLKLVRAVSSALVGVYADVVPSQGEHKEVVAACTEGKPTAQGVRLRAYGPDPLAPHSSQGRSEVYQSLTEASHRQRTDQFMVFTF